MLFDDPLSALDANVSNFLMENTMCHELKGKTRIIVTHAVQFLKYADCIFYVENGEIVFSGTYQNLKQTEYLRDITDTSSGVSDISASEDEKMSSGGTLLKKKKKKEEKPPAQKEANEVRALGPAEKLDPILSKFASEEKSKGTISCSVIHSYIVNTGGYIIFLLVIAFTILGSAMQVYGAQYLLKWSGDKNFDDSKQTWSNFLFYISVLYTYCCIAGIRFMVLLLLGIRYSRRAHSTMVWRVLHSQVEEFVEKVSMGRLLNRFTKDLDVLDKSIMKTSAMMLAFLVIVGIDIFFMVRYSDPVVVVALLVYVIIAFWIQRISMGVRRDAVRLEAISKSPIVSWTAETMNGLPQIRTMNKISYVTKNMVELLHTNLVNSILSAGIDAWFKLRIGLFNILIAQIPCYAYLLYKGLNYDVTSVAMFILISTIFADDILKFLTFFSEVEANLVSVERVNFFETVPYEKNYFNFEKERKEFQYPNVKVNLRSLTLSHSEKVVKNGEVVFENVTARYGEDAEPVLKNLNFTVRPGEKIGIVGRTGAGKSSLIKLFFMTLKPSQGRILVDGTDVTKVDLKILRNEVMVVTQDAALFQGSLAENIDPNMTEDQYPEAMRILTELGIKNKNILEKGMETKVDADGANFSQGEKQIICYARTLVTKKKLIILDEATANIDVKTEQSIKRIQETKFADSTMFIIAHRLKTVMHCDRIMVLKFGHIEEFDSPQKLLENPNGLFRDMYDKMLEGEEE